MEIGHSAREFDLLVQGQSMPGDRTRPFSVYYACEYSHMRGRGYHWTGSRNPYGKRDQ